jgi:hypothetical protein
MTNRVKQIDEIITSLEDTTKHSGSFELSSQAKEILLGLPKRWLKLCNKLNLFDDDSPKDSNTVTVYTNFDEEDTSSNFQHECCDNQHLVHCKMLVFGFRVNAIICENCGELTANPKGPIQALVLWLFGPLWNGAVEIKEN